MPRCIALYTTRMSAPLFAAALLALPVQAQEPAAGAYLAARQASIANNFVAAAPYTARALAADPGNGFLQDSALIALIALGDMETAVTLARQMPGGPDKSQIAVLLLVSVAARNDNYDEILALIDAATSRGPLLDGLLRAWAQLGTGEMSLALQGFDALVAEPGFAAFGNYHKALALAMAGDFEGADAILSSSANGGARATRRGVEARLMVLSQLERNADALALIAELFGDTPDPGMTALRNRLQAGEALTFSLVGSARDGLAEVFFTIAGALNSESPDSYALAYARLAEYLRPDHADAILLGAALLERLGQHDLAAAAFARVPRDSGALAAAEMGRANALYRAGRSEDALAALQQLAAEIPDQAGIWIALGDTLRRESQFPEAAAAYDRAIALRGEARPEDWFVYYARGIAQERAKVWAKAEADFRTALRLNPDQPQVLNYLGYSYVDRYENLAEALAMIESAVRAMPDDGAIIDSLGWALYRLGRYGEAVVQMERAVERMPVDSLVNDHLGDVLWAVGRQREAVFQWRRALAFAPESDAEADRIRRKLELGLDAVLADEGAPPLQAAPANGN